MRSTIPIAIAIVIAGGLIAAAIYFRPERSATAGGRLPVILPTVVEPATWNEPAELSTPPTPTPPIHTSEELRKVMEEWERIWFQDRPPSARRSHGGVI